MLAARLCLTVWKISVWRIDLSQRRCFLSELLLLGPKGDVKLNSLRALLRVFRPVQLFRNFRCYAESSANTTLKQAYFPDLVAPFVVESRLGRST